MARSAVFLVRLSRASALPITVAFVTAPGTAVPPGDFTPTSGTITFAPGQTSAQIVVAIRDDVPGATEEQFTVELSSPVNASLNRRSGVGVIPGRAIDEQPYITIDNPTVPSA